MRDNTISVTMLATIASKVFEVVSGSGIGRWLVRPLLPKPGEGPSEKTMDEGSFQCDFVGKANNGARVRGILKGQGDPGNRITVKCLCEAAFVLALSGSAMSGTMPRPGGVLTPVTGLGDALTARLSQRGIAFQILGS